MAIPKNPFGSSIAESAVEQASRNETRGTQSSFTGNTPNADALRAVLTSLGYTEKGKELYLSFDSFLNAFQLTKNFGEATASKFGLKKITGDAFSVLAADLQDPPELIFEMAKNWLEGNSYVICERTKRNDPIFSKFLANLYYKFLTKFIMPTYPKKGFDLFLMDAKYLPVIIESSKSSSIPLILSWIGIEPLKIGYVRQTREHGKSTWTIFKRINLLLDVLFSFSRKPIRIVSSIGAVTALAGLIYGISVIIERLNGITGSQGTASLIALVSFTSGLVLLTLGIIAEYIWRIWDEVNNRPDGIEKFKN
jgi:dolichol-phosphate mannosyltransferase